MSRLLNTSNNEVLATQVSKATSFKDRLVGLLGHEALDQGEALWISNCNSIHTFFMRFPIDVIFVDKALKVKNVYYGIKPWRVTFPLFGANSVFELAAGSLQEKSISKGDQLYVGP